MKIFIQTRVNLPKQTRCNLGSLFLFLKNATHEIQAHRLYCLILFNKPNSLHVFSNSFISQYDKMFSSKPHSMQARLGQTPAKPEKKPQNMTPCITIKELIIDLEGASDSECEFQDLKPLVVFTGRYKRQIVNLIFF